MAFSYLAKAIFWSVSAILILVFLVPQSKIGRSILGPIDHAKLPVLNKSFSSDDA